MTDVWGKLKRRLQAYRDRWLGPRLGRLYQHPPRRWPRRQLPPLRLRQPPRISIVTPSYNQGVYLERTLRSVLDQAYPALEYIVQDGGSSDGSVAILQRYQQQFAHWESAPDTGQANALNRGFRWATGEILAYLNSDDLLLPGTLALVADYFTRHPEVDVVYGQRLLIDERERLVGVWVLPPHDDAVLPWQDFVPQETLFWRRSLWERVGGRFDETLHFALDWELLLRFRAAGARFVRLPQYLGAFRVHAQQKTQTLWEQRGRAEAALLRERYLGRAVSDAEVAQAVRPYLRRHGVYHLLYRLGVL